MALKNNWRGLLFGVFCTLILVAFRIVDPPILSTLRGAGFDTLQTLWPRSNVSPQPVRVVDIDEASLAKLGQWPWPRSQLAKLVEELGNMGASAIVFDIVFPEPDRLSAANDVELATAIKNYPVVNAFATSSGQPTAVPILKAGFAQTGNPAINAVTRLGLLTHNLPALDDAASGLGSMNIDLSRDQGITRQIPLLMSDGKNFYPSLTLEALRVAQGADTYVVNASPVIDDAIESIRVGELEIPTSEAGMFQIYYRPNDEKMFVSAADVIAAQHRESLRPLIQGHIVLIGTSAVGLLDMRTSALGESLPGVAIHAQALEQMISGSFLKQPEWVGGAEYLGVGIVGFLITLLTLLLRPWQNLFMIGSVFATMAGLVVLAFLKFGILVDFTFPALALATVFIATTAYKLLIVDSEGRQLRRVFGHYVSPSILSEIERNPSALKLGGELREVTVMFVDIENFTPLSEKLNPEQLVQTVNSVLDTCSTAILSEGGTIDKYIGDAVMAFWNAPVQTADHQYHAALAALKIQEAIKTLNESETVSNILKSIDQWPVGVRVGFASGISTVGNMGSSQRFDYSVLGDAVNTAARAEEACKYVGSKIVLAGLPTEKTKTLALLAAGSIAMKGKAAKTQVSAILGTETMANEIDFQNMRNEFGAALPRLTTAKTAAFTKTYPQFESFFSKLSARKQDFTNP
jgi:adenylate cyclase